MEDLGSFLSLLSKLAAIIATLAGAFWIYVKFVLEKGLFPPAEFKINCNTVG